MESSCRGSTFKAYLTKLFIIKKIVGSIQTELFVTFSPLFVSLKLITLNDIYKFEVENVMYKYVHRSLPQYCSDIFTFTHDIHIHETRQTSHILHLTALTVTSSNSFLC